MKLNFHRRLNWPPGLGVRQSSAAFQPVRYGHEKRQPPSRRSGAMARREGGRTAAVQAAEAFSLLEIMVAVSLLAVIIVGLLAMFYQVQRAFRAGTAQADVMEGGRATMNLLTRDLQEMAATDVEFTTNFVVVPSESPPLPANAGTVQVLP